MSRSFESKLLNLGLLFVGVALAAEAIFISAAFWLSSQFLIDVCLSWCVGIVAFCDFAALAVLIAVSFFSFRDWRASK